MSEHRYTYLGIAFHWTMVALVTLQLGWGWWMQRVPAGYQMFDAYQRHNDIGFVIFLLAFIRLAWRLATPRPPYTEEVEQLPAWQHLAARATHLGFYGLMIGLPVTGWILLSATAREVPIIVFGVLPIAHLSWIAEAPPNQAARIEDVAEAAHWVLVWGMVILTVMHTAAALRRHLVERDPVLMRMIPVLSELPEEPPEEGIGRA